MSIRQVEDILNLLFEECEALPVLVLHYGSQENGRDIDLLAIYDYEPIRSEMVIGRLDLCAISMEGAKRLITAYDPIVTEPLLTGRLVFGDKKVIETLKAYLDNVKPTSSTLRHLLLRSFHSYSNAIECLRVEPTMSQARLVALNISYAMSYLAFASYYEQHSGPAIPLSQLLKNLPKKLKNLWHRTQRFKESPCPLTDEANALIETFEKYFLG